MWLERGDSVDIKSLQALNLLYTLRSGLLLSESPLVSDLFGAM